MYNNSTITLKYTLIPFDMGESVVEVIINIMNVCVELMVGQRKSAKTCEAISS